MRSLIPWRRKRERAEQGAQPLMSLARLRNEMDTLFERFFRDPWGLVDWEWPAGGLAAVPRTDLAETEDNVTVTMELPGVNPEDVQIDITGDLLTVRGEKREEKQEKKKDYHYVERQFGSFQRTVQLPSTVDPDKVDATYRNGVLTITIAKHAEARPRKIKVRHA